MLNVGSLPPSCVPSSNGKAGKLVCVSQAGRWAGTEGRGEEEATILLGLLIFSVALAEIPVSNH